MNKDNNGENWTNKKESVFDLSPVPLTDQIAYGPWPYSTIQEWRSMDEEDWFKENWSKNRQELIDNGWDKNSKIEYRINGYGFRDVEFEKPVDALFFGCSNTFGIGIHEHQTWVYLVKQQLNLTGYNFGYPGGSLETCYRLAKFWVAYFKPKYVFLFEPPGIRLEFIGHLGEHHLSSIFRFTRLGGKFLEEYCYSFNNEQISKHRNIDAIKHVCNENNAKLFFQLYTDTIDKARDLTHPGPKTQKIYADRFIQQFNR